MTPQASTPGEGGQRAAPGRSIRIRVGDARLSQRGSMTTRRPTISPLSCRSRSPSRTTTASRRLPRCLASYRWRACPPATIQSPETSATGPPMVSWVLYYDDAAPYWDGIVRIGEVEGDLSAVRQLPQAARVTIERAG